MPALSPFLAHTLLSRSSFNVFPCPPPQKSSQRQRLIESQVLPKTPNFHTHILDIKNDYRVAFDFSADMQPTTIIIEPLIKTLRSYKLACQSPEVGLMSLPPFLPSSPLLPLSLPLSRFLLPSFYLPHSEHWGNSSPHVLCIPVIFCGRVVHSHVPVVSGVISTKKETYTHQHTSM